MDSYGSTHGGSSLDLNGQSNRNQAVWHPQCHAFPGFQWSSGGNQRTGSSFKGPVPGIPEQGEIQTGNLVPLWRAAYGTQPTRISEEPHASWLFWTLVVISMVWTFGMMALRKADIGEFFAEFTRFTITTGFF